MHVCPSAWNSDPTGGILNEIGYFTIFRKSVENIQVLLKSDKNNGQFTQTPAYRFDHILLDGSS